MTPLKRAIKRLERKIEAEAAKKHCDIPYLGGLKAALEILHAHAAATTDAAPPTALAAPTLQASALAAGRVDALWALGEALRCYVRGAAELTDLRRFDSIKREDAIQWGMKALGFLTSGNKTCATALETLQAVFDRAR